MRDGGGKCTYTRLLAGALNNAVAMAGREREFKTLFAELRAEMRKHEPGCVYYSLLKSRTNPRAYIVEEPYRDEAALGAHQSLAHGEEF